MQNIDSDLIRGNIDTIILKTMLNEDKYGLDIIKEVSDRSSGTYELKQPTLYSCLKRLENQELISSYWVDSDIGGKRHYYKLTDKGREFYNKKQEEWSKSKFIIDNLLSNYNYEEYMLVKKDDYDQVLKDKVAKAETKQSDDEYKEESENPQETVDTDLDFEENSADEETLAETESDSFADETISEDEETENVEETDDSPVYFDNQEENNVFDLKETEDEFNSQSENELNILNRLHEQDDEEINTYYGDKQSYTNHLNQKTDFDVEQQNLLFDDESDNEVDNKINSFSDAFNKYNNFDSSSENQENEEIDFNVNEPIIDDEEIDYEEIIDEDDDLNELKALHSNESTGFFKSYDNPEYDSTPETFNHNEDLENETEDVSNFEFENESFDFDNQNDFQEDTETYDESEETELFSTPLNPNYVANQTSFEEINNIIENNISNNFGTDNSFKASNGSYKEKLSNLSMYSKTTIDENNQANNTDAIEKAKDISTLTKELEDEGIKLKQHYKSVKSKELDKTYLLSNKINLMKSLIMFFGYVFILSAVYIVLNNTPFKDSYGFSIKYFLIGFIPFAAILAFWLVAYLINPYKKVPARYASRIMSFISIIITIQLLLITYCINLQVGFYSFNQLEYNHLYWIIPTIISFAPIIDNLVYKVLFNSKNFNV